MRSQNLFNILGQFLTLYLETLCVCSDLKPFFFFFVDSPALIIHPLLLPCSFIVCLCVEYNYLNGKQKLFRLGRAFLLGRILGDKS